MLCIPASCFVKYNIPCSEVYVSHILSWRLKKQTLPVTDGNVIEANRVIFQNFRIIISFGIIAIYTVGPFVIFGLLLKLLMLFPKSLIVPGTRLDNVIHYLVNELDHSSWLEKPDPASKSQMELEVTHLV